MMTVYLPNVRTIKSYTAHEESEIGWRVEWCHLTNQPDYEYAFVAGKARTEDDFFQTAEDAVAAANILRAREIERKERALKKLRRIHAQAGNII
ncbi:MAG: hypothetical protein ABF593_04745 [Acetobacter papayae]|uniref:hypothetical protein n=1 Tax=Acetobacter papayae TaxID=1076592 RepID=UPI0039E9D07C